MMEQKGLTRASGGDTFKPSFFRRESPERHSDLLIVTQPVRGGAGTLFSSELPGLLQNLLFPPG